VSTEHGDRSTAIHGRRSPVTEDERLADGAIREWLGEGATRTPLLAMNSSAWMVSSGQQRYVLKVSSAAEEAALRAAAWLDGRGLRTGAPARMAVRGDRLVALLRFVDGRGLGPTDADTEILGETLGRAHSLLVGAPVPQGLERWPWAWLDPAVIDAPDLRAAAASAIESAERLAPTLTHGILHADPAPEAFLADGEDVALIDWGAACHGPLLYDVASAWMYAGERVLAAYARTAPIGADELARAADFLAFRWAVQASYFSDRIHRRDLTGLSGDAGNDKGLADARRALLGSSSRIAAARLAADMPHGRPDGEIGA
jgi:Ser/Thr protein kinase RdoA (MazF antagonist)